MAAPMKGDQSFESARSFSCGLEEAGGSAGVNAMPISLQG